MVRQQGRIVFQNRRLQGGKKRVAFGPHINVRGFARLGMKL